MIKVALNNLYQNKKNILITIAIATTSMFVFLLAIEVSNGIESYIKVNSPLYIFLQLFLSLLSSILIGVSLTLFINILKQRKDTNNLTVFQALASLLFAVGTTGCYVCGTVLLPFFGVAASFGSLPFSGLEIKFITLLLILLSIKEFSKNYMGICEIRNSKNLELIFTNSTYSFNVSGLYYTIRPVTVTVLLLSLIFVLPTLLPDKVSAGLNKPNMNYCPKH